MAAVNPRFLARNFVQNYHYDPRSVLILRSKECMGHYEYVAATELSGVPNGAPLPPYDTKIESCQYNSRRLDADMPKSAESEGNANYKSVVKQLESELEKNANAQGVIIGYYFDRPSSSIKQALEEARQLLAKRGCSPKRYFIHLMQWPGETPIPHGPEPKYPQIYISEITDKC